MQSKRHANASRTCRRVGNRCETQRWGTQEGALPGTVPRARCRQVSTVSTDWQHARGTAGRGTARPCLSRTVYEGLPACSQTPPTLARCLLSRRSAKVWRTQVGSLAGRRRRT